MTQVTGSLTPTWSPGSSPLSTHWEGLGSEPVNDSSLLSNKKLVSNVAHWGRHRGVVSKAADCGPASNTGTRFRLSCCTSDPAAWIHL